MINPSNIFADLSNTNVVANPDNGNPVDDQPAHGVLLPNGQQSFGGHGTFVSSIIAARGHNAYGRAGVAWTAKILPIKIFDQYNGGTTTFIIAQAYNLAVSKGAKIINASFGGNGASYDQTVINAMKGAKTNGAVIVAAAGNTDSASGTPGGGADGPPDRFEVIPQTSPLDASNDDDLSPVYPAASELPNVIAVANNQENSALNSTSRHGQFSVDLAAPGTDIASALNQNSYNAGLPYYTLGLGTSFSAPHVSGALALVRQKFPASNYWELLDRIRMGVTLTPALDGNLPAGQLRDYKGLVTTGGRLNAYNSLLPRSKMYNLSCRGRVETGNAIMINGFVLRGPTTVVIRALGPTLTDAGVPGALADPYLELHNAAGALITSNDNWKDTQMAAIQATGLAPPHDSESAIYANLGPGTYSAQVSGVGGSVGTGLTEVYELSDQTNPANDLNRTTNLSSRVMVRTGSQIAIVGIIVHGLPTPQPQLPRRVLIRALGPTLGGFGVPNYLPNPYLRLLDANGVQLATNNDWKTADTSPTGIYKAKITAAGYAPVDPAGAVESIIVATLTPGTYTVECSGVNNSQGIALVEAYEY